MAAPAAAQPDTCAGQQVCQNPDGTQLPGFDELKNITNGLAAWGLFVAMAALVIGAAAWAIGSHSQNPRMAQAGKMALLASMAGGLFIGGAPHIINFFYNNGTANIHNQ